MLHFIEDISPVSAIAVWHITETLEELQNAFSEQDRAVIAKAKPEKQCEYFATRKALPELCAHMGFDYQGMVKDEFGKPFLINSDWHISVSHAYPFVACMLHKQAPCGIDIERPREQHRRIKNKFLTEEELQETSDDLEKLCQWWSGKEALYKIYGKKNLIFKENLKVTSGNDGFLNGIITVGEQQNTFELRILPLEDYFIVFNI